MTTFGYLVFLLRVNEPRRPHELHRLSAAGDSDVDLLNEYEAHLSGLGASFHPIDKSDEGFRVKESRRVGRTIRIRVNKGPAGGTGEAYHLDDDESIETGDRQALLSGLHALLVVPENCYYGLLFVERVGVRHLKDVLAQLVLVPAGKNAGVMTRVESFAEARVWELDLAIKQPLRVSEVMAVRVTGEDASTVEDTNVKVITEGGAVRALGPQLKEMFHQRVVAREKFIDDVSAKARLIEKRREGGDAFTVQDEDEYQRVLREVEEYVAPNDSKDEIIEALRKTVAVSVSAPDSTMKHRRYEVGMGERNTVTRNLVIEGDAIPQFVYSLGVRLSERGLRDTWLAHATSILKARGVTLPAGWDRD